MEQLEELQGRIQAALDRIGGGVVALEEKHANRPVPTLEELDMQKHAELLADIEDERMANAQLKARLTLLHGRLVDMEKKVAAVDGADDLIAMQAELELLRNEAGKSVEAEALRTEVARLKQDLENVRNQAASERETFEDDKAELIARNTELKAELDEAAAQAAPMADIEPLEAELRAAQQELAELRDRLAMAEASDGDAYADPDGEEEGVSGELDLRLAELDSELQSLRASNDQLRESNAALRAANAEGLGDPALINSGLEAEVQGLRAARASDQAEVHAVLARLEPLLSTAPNLPEGEEA